MKIIKPFNNNVVMARDVLKGDIIVIGSGIGFHAKAGDKIDSKKVSRIFTCRDNDKLTELIEQIPASYLELTEKIVDHCRDEMGMTINEEIYLHLTDHLYFAMKRDEEELNLGNPFLTDIRQFYPEEYCAGKYAKTLIWQMLQVKISDDEVGYIAMHIIEARTYQRHEDFKKIFDVIETAVDYIKKAYLKQVEEDSLAYTRLVNHVKYFAKRYVEQKENDTKDDFLNETIQKAFKEEIHCIDGMSEYFREKFGYAITQSEKNYLVLHLRNCREIKE